MVVKVIGHDARHVYVVSCSYCASILEYVRKDASSEHGSDEFIKCPACNKHVSVNFIKKNSN